MADIVPLTRTASSEMTADRARQRSDSPTTGNALIGPNEVWEYPPNSNPDNVLGQSQRLHDELEMSLKDLARDKDHFNIEDFDVKSQEFLLAVAHFDGLDSMTSTHIKIAVESDIKMSTILS